MKKTKVICTIGPATAEYQMLVKLYRAGMNLVRLNMAHGDETFFRGIVNNVRKLNKSQRANIGVLWDLKGPEVRVGDLRQNIQVKKGDTVRFGSVHKKDLIPVHYDGLADDVEAGDAILLDNGLIRLKVLRIQRREVVCQVMNKGRIRSHSHINLQGKTVHLPSLSEKDKKYLMLGVQLQADWFALSFVRTAKDILELRKHLKRLRSQALVMAKIETPLAVKNLDDIMKVSDAIMVARGDLGAEVPFEEVPKIQLDIVTRCRNAGKPVVVATHMLESMITTPMPTRAEATDIAFAVTEKVDATMLSGETAVGQYPLESLDAMVRVITATESQWYMTEHLEAPDAVGDKEEILLAASYLANNVHAKAILVFTRSGETAWLIAKNRPLAQIVAFSDRAIVVRQLSLICGIEAYFLPLTGSSDQLIREALEILKKRHSIKTRDKVVVASDMRKMKSKQSMTVLLKKVS